MKNLYKKVWSMRNKGSKIFDRNLRGLRALKTGAFGLNLLGISEEVLCCLRPERTTRNKPPLQPLAAWGSISCISAGYRVVNTTPRSCFATWFKTLTRFIRFVIKASRGIVTNAKNMLTRQKKRYKGPAVEGVADDRGELSRKARISHLFSFLVTKKINEK